MITKVTITGADDSIHPEALIGLAREFPFAEFAILLSRSNFGFDRFPSRYWLDHLKSSKQSYPSLKLACHLCGSFMRDFVNGQSDRVFGELSWIWKIFDRFQINTHAELLKTNPEDLLRFINSHPEHEFIFQYDNVNTALFESLSNGGAENISALFDLSHGTGVLPSQWSKPLSYARCGYAGGLSPDNLDQQVRKIENLVGDTKVWIDMETHVRSHNGKIFDLTKVRRCLEITKPFVYGG